MNTSQARRFIVAIIVAVTLATSVLPVQFASGQASRASTDAADVSAMKLTVELYSEVFNDQKAAGAERLIADDAIIHTPRGDFTGPDGLLEYLDGINRLYPDASFDVTSIDIDGDTIVVQWTMTATHFHPDPIHGSSIVWASSPGETTIRVADGQVAELNQAERGTTVAESTDSAVAYGPLE